MNPECVSWSHADSVQVSHSGLYIIPVHTKLTPTATPLLAQATHLVYSLHSTPLSQIRLQKPQPYTHLQEALSDAPHPKSPTHLPRPHTLSSELFSAPQEGQLVAPQDSSALPHHTCRCHTLDLLSPISSPSPNSTSRSQMQAGHLQEAFLDSYPWPSPGCSHGTPIRGWWELPR